MSTYLLLRDNKETGPYSVEDLVRKGLKAYDLVWVNDRSAAWRYPSEIAELRPYAPVVEEQPYDRFYKRASDQETSLKSLPVASEPPLSQPISQPVSQPEIQPEIQPRSQPITEFVSHPLSQIANQPISQPVTQSASQPVSQIANQPITQAANQPGNPPATDSISEPAASKPRRSVFVTMPGNRPAEVPRPAQPVERTEPKQVTVPVVPVNADASDPYSKYNGSSPKPDVAASRINDETTPRIKFSQPLDEIKERYVKTLSERKEKMAKHDQWKSHAAKAAIVVGLIGGGLLVGYMMRSNSTPTSLASTGSRPDIIIPDSVVQQGVPEEQADEQLNAVAPGQQNELNTKTDDAAARPSAATSSDNISKEPDTGEAVDVRTSPASKEETARRTVLFDENKFAHNNSIVNPETGERSRSSRDERPDKPIAPAPVTKPVPRNEWEGQVSVATNDYKRVAFGGIRNLELTVTNHGKKQLQNVVVQLDYLKPSEEPLKSEQIRFKDIEANSSSTIRVPDTNRGIKVSYRIVQVIPAANEAMAGN